MSWRGSTPVGSGPPGIGGDGVETAYRSLTLRIAETLCPRHEAVLRALGRALAIGPEPPSTWRTFAEQVSGRLDEDELVALASGMIAALARRDPAAASALFAAAAEDLAPRADRKGEPPSPSRAAGLPETSPHRAGMPLPPLTTLREEAEDWAALADESELLAYASAILVRLPRRFLRDLADALAVRLAA